MTSEEASVLVDEVLAAIDAESHLVSKHEPFFRLWNVERIAADWKLIADALLGRLMFARAHSR
jgi:hypothetical protein